MKEFIEACVSADDESNLVDIRDSSVVLVGLYFGADTAEGRKLPLAGILHQVALSAHAMNLPPGYFVSPTVEDMQVEKARTTLACVWGYACHDSHKVALLYSATQSLLRANGFDLEETKLFWIERLKTL